MALRTCAAIALAVLAGLVPALPGEEAACSDAAGPPAAGEQPPSCAGREPEDEDVFASAQLRRIVVREHHEAAGEEQQAWRRRRPHQPAEEHQQHWRQRPSPTPSPPPLRHLGLLGLDGYYWPTQPGDINDLRTWCSVSGPDGKAYKCNNPQPCGEDEFGVKIATVENGTWPKIQRGVGTWEGLKEAFETATKFLMEQESVKAIMGNAGWFTWYQFNVSQLMIEANRINSSLKIKPFLGGSPAMLAALGSLINGSRRFIGNGKDDFRFPDGWDLLKKKEDKLVLLTSNNDLGDPEKMTAMLKAAGVSASTKHPTWDKLRAVLNKKFTIHLPEDNAQTTCFIRFLIQIAGLFPDLHCPRCLLKFMKVAAQKIIVVPWSETLGYGSAVVDPGAMFHNVASQIRGSSIVASNLLSTILEYTRNGSNITGIIMESTEMPAYSNWVRNITKLPVWDSTVVGKCLVSSAPNFSTAVAEAHGVTVAVFRNSAFKKCMMGWWDTDRWEPGAGYQKNGSILYYDTMNLTTSQLDKLTCTGGRPTVNKTIGRRMEEFDTGKFGPDKIDASCLRVSPCGGRTWQGLTCPPSEFGGDFANYGGCFCEGSCPAGYYCGSDDGGVAVPGLEYIPGGRTYIYGVRGEKYPYYRYADQNHSKPS